MKVRGTATKPKTTATAVKPKHDSSRKVGSVRSKPASTEQPPDVALPALRKPPATARRVERGSTGRISSTSQAEEATARRLIALGYSSAVAHRIATDAPALANTILTLPIDKTGRRKVRVHGTGGLDELRSNGWAVSVRLYRGVCVPVGKLDPKFVDTRLPGLLFYSDSITEPHKYASGEALKQREHALARGDFAGTVVESEVPSFLTYYYGHPVLRIADVSDASLFFSRKAEVDLRTPYFPKLAIDELGWTTWSPNVALAGATKGPPSPQAPVRTKSRGGVELRSIGAMATKRWRILSRRRMAPLGSRSKARLASS